MIPQVNKTYNFYDDGKAARRYDAKVIRVITKEDATKVMFPTYCNEFTDWLPSTVTQNEDPAGEMSLYDKWQEMCPEYDWIFDQDTDYFVECSIPKYDEYTIWFARTIDNGWFSMDIQNSWQGGRLEVK